MVSEALQSVTLSTHGLSSSAYFLQERAQFLTMYALCFPPFSICGQYLLYFLQTLSPLSSVPCLNFLQDSGQYVSMYDAHFPSVPI